MSESIDKPKLTYFNGKGRGTPIRMVAFIGGIDFEDHRISFPDFSAIRSNEDIIPLNSLPVFRCDQNSMIITQSNAITRYMAKLAGNGLYPDDPYLAMQCDSVLSCVEDMAGFLTESMHIADQAEKENARREYVAETGPTGKYMRYISRILQENGGPFVCGSDLTIADMKLAGLISWYSMLDGVDPEATMQPYPLIVALKEAYDSHPKVIEYEEYLKSKTQN